MKLSRIDIKILSILQRCGRMPNKAIAEEAAISPSACFQHIRRLKGAGIISEYRAIIHPQLLGETLTVFSQFTLADHKQEDFRRFEEAISSIPFIVEASVVSGGFDYLIKFVTRGINHYQSIIDSMLASNIGITKYFSYIVIRSPIPDRVVPVAQLLDADRVWEG